MKEERQNPVPGTLGSKLPQHLLDQVREWAKKQRSNTYEIIAMETAEYLYSILPKGAGQWVDEYGNIMIVIGGFAKEIKAAELKEDVLDIDFDGAQLIQITKQEDASWKVTNGLSGYGYNNYDEIRDLRIMVAIPLTETPSSTAEEKLAIAVEGLKKIQQMELRWSNAHIIASETLSKINLI